MGPGVEIIGARITVRLHEPGGGFRDVVGTLETLTSVRKTDGSLAHFSHDQIAIWREIKPVPDRAGHGAPLSIRIQEIEIAANATWPAKEELRIGGWLLRASGLFTMRANSVLPLGEVPYGNPGMELEKAINTVVRFYRERKIVPVFHIPLPSYEELDRELSERGWEEKVLANVMVADISEKYPEISDEIIWETSDTPSNEWLEVQHDEPIAQIMGSYPAIYVGGRINGRLIAVGRASNFEKWTTLSRLFVSEDFRGRGIGRTCMERLLNNAREKGASKALLQVDSKNAHAISLYENLGFRFHHSYRYRALAHSEKNQPC